MTEQRRDDRVTDANVDAAWRQAASEQPPAEVDAAILAAARAAVRRDAQERLPARPPRRWAKWQPLAAAAGVIGLSFLLVQMLPRDHLTRPPATQDEPRAPVAASAVRTIVYAGIASRTAVAACTASRQPWTTASASGSITSWSSTTGGLGRPRPSRATTSSLLANTPFASSISRPKVLR